MTRAAVALAVLLLAATLVPLALVEAGPLRALVTGRVATGALPPPPTLTLHSPADGEGVGLQVELVGVAHAERTRVLDVEIRVDDAPWESLPDAPRGAAASAFRALLTLSEGEHVIEARATDGEAWSLPARVRVLARQTAPPTVKIVTPSDGEGVSAGMVDVLGTVRGAGVERVLVRAGSSTVEAQIVGAAGDGALWSATIPLMPGDQDVRAVAEGAGGRGLERRHAVTVDASAPPTLTVLKPSSGASFGSSGSDDCPTSCILFAGVASGASGIADVLVGLDEQPLVSLRDDGGILVGEGAGASWSWRADVSSMWSGPHVARLVAVDVEGRRSVERQIEFIQRTPRELRIVGDDAPTLTGTLLEFEVSGDDPARWLLDGAPLGNGTSIEFTLPRPGHHVLTAQVPDDEGQLRSARASLFALNRPPTLALSAGAGVATVPVPLTAVAIDPDGRIVRYEWDFGDGTGTQATLGGAVEHAFPRGGTYRVNVTAEDDSGALAHASLVLSIANAVPLASFRWEPERPTTQDDVTFFDGSADPEGRLVSWRWSFGDGTFSDEASPVHRFAERGPHEVTLTVRDADGSSAFLREVVDVANIPPAVDFRHEPLFPQTNEEVRFVDATAKPDGTLLAWSWDFGDGKKATGPNVTHAYAAPGEYNVTLVVEDDAGTRGSRRIPLLIADGAPLVRSIEAAPARPRALDDVRFRAVAVDPEDELARVSWDFGDGTTSDDAEPTHRFAKSGAYEITVAAFDETGQRGVLAIRLDVLNALPLVQVGPADGGYAGAPTLIEAAATDPDGEVVAYRFDMDGDGVADCLGPDARCVFTYPIAGTYVVNVTARDAEGGEGWTLRPVEILPARFGLGAPSVTIDRPAPGAGLRGEVLVQGRAKGPSDVVRVEAQLRDRAWALSARAQGGWMPATGTDRWQLVLDTRAFPDGSYDLVVRALDEAGSANETRILVAFENGKPTSEIQLRVANLEAGQVLREDLVVRGTAFHPTGVQGVRWQVDDGPWRDATGNPLSFVARLDFASLRPGDHVLRVEAHKGALDRALLEVPFTVEDLRPILVVEEGPTPTLYARVRAEGEASPDARVLWRVDTGIWREVETTDGRFLLDAPTDDVAGGPHVVQLKAVHDASGLQTEAVSFNVRVLNPTVREAVAELEERATEPVRETPAGAVAIAALAGASLFARRRRS